MRNQNSLKNRNAIHLLFPHNRAQAVVRSDIFAFYVRLLQRFGDLDSAIAALPHLLEVPAGITTADLRLNPIWDPLRKDPRFQKFCQDK